MITLTLIALLICVPAARIALRGLLAGVFSLLGLAFFITKDSAGRRRGF